MDCLEFLREEPLGAWAIFCMALNWVVIAAYFFAISCLFLSWLLDR